MGLFDGGSDQALAAAISGGFSFVGGERRNAAQKDISRGYGQWMERMSNTAYARAMDDMRNAGLNPILAGKLGGATTPGITAPVLTDTITPAITTAMDAMSTTAETEKTNSETVLNDIEKDIKSYDRTNQYAKARLMGQFNKFIDAAVINYGKTEAGWDDFVMKYGQRIEDNLQLLFGKDPDIVHDLSDKFIGIPGIGSIFESVTGRKKNAPKVGPSKKGIGTRYNPK